MRECDCIKCVIHGGDGVLWGPLAETEVVPDHQRRVVVTRAERVNGEVNTEFLVDVTFPEEFTEIILAVLASQVRFRG